MKSDDLEFWLRGPVDDVPALLQPVAHALLQAQSEIETIIYNLPRSLLWQTVAGNASPAFHLQHIAGVLDRLFTYADDKVLTEEQLHYLSMEGKRNITLNKEILIQNMASQIQSSISYLKKVDANKLTDVRYVGRNKIKSTKIGLLFHAAEHTMRHTGQLLVTAKVLLQ